MPTHTHQLQLSRRATSLKPSSTLAINTKAQELRQAGLDVLSFAAGEPDFATPAPIVKAAHEALDRGETRYSPVPGDPETRRVIAEKFTNDNGLPNVTPDHVVITAGGKHALAHVLGALIDPVGADEEPQQVLFPTPVWVSYPSMAKLAGAEVVEMPTTPESDFKITPEQLEEAITPRSRVLMLNSPSNPCATMYSESELRDLARVIAEATESRAPDLCVLSDELYEKIIYGGIEHFSIGSIPEIAERTITVNGLAKAYAMTGWRVGYLAGSGDFGLQVAGAAKRLQAQSTTCIVTFILPAVRVALTQCADDIERMRQAFAQRAEIIYELITQIPGVKCPKPTGAFYVFPDISTHFGKTSAGGMAIDSANDFAKALLDENLLACVPGEDFGTGGEKCCRISFACSEDQIRAGMKRLGAFVDGLK
jgi:aspartate aminotransferase